MRKKETAGEIGVIYARYSSHNQKDASIEQQVAEASAHAQSLGIQISEIYADRGISGKTDRRPSFQRLMRDAEKGRFAYVIAWKSNRMGRNMLQAMINEARLNELGIRVLYTEEDFDDTAAGRFALRSMMNVNQFYSENMAEDIRRGMLDNARQCKITNGHLPLGYKKGSDGRYALDAPNAAIVQEIFTRVACGDLFVDIAEDLNARGVRTSRGKPWSKSSFQTLLHNERYMGIYIYGDVRIKDGIPRIISDDLFWDVQDKMNHSKHSTVPARRGSDYVLTGKLYCGHCKSPMIGLSGTSHTGQKHYYYVCQQKRTAHTCSKSNVQRDTIERAAVQAIQQYALNDDVIDWIADATIAYNKQQETLSPAAALEQQLEDTRKSIHNLMAAIEQGIITPTTKNRLMELESEESRLSASLAAARANMLSITKEDIIAGLQLFRNGRVDCAAYRAKLIDTFVIAIYLYDDHFKVIFSFSGNSEREIPLTSEEIDGKIAAADRFDWLPIGSTKQILSEHLLFSGGFAVKV